MNKKLFRTIIFILGISLAIVIAGCGSADEEQGKEGNDAENSNLEENYNEAVNHTIIGIEPGAGISVTTEKAIDEYENLAGWTVEQSSTAAMLIELEKAYDNEEPIIITGWNPHWMFEKYPDMKYLEDPKGIYGEEEVIKTLARLGLEEDKPEAYKLIDQFNWETEDMESIMFEAQHSGEEIEVIAQQWVDDNAETVNEWTEGVADVDGVEVELATTPWESELASANVLAQVLKHKGFQVTITPVDVAVVYEAVANGDADATLSAWMPMTHKDFYEEFEDKFVDLGPNLEGAKIGLVVPEYMDIDSIEDLKAK